MPVTGQYNVQLHQGALDVTGHVQHSGNTTVVDINQFTLEGVKADYVHMAQTKQKEAARAKKGAEKVKEAHRDPTLVLKVANGKILHSDVGFINKASSPDYRVFLSDMNLEVDHFSNRPEEGMGQMKLTGKFMGSGPTTVTGSFRPEKPNPDFDLHVRIVKTQVQTLNQLLRAYGQLDTTGGTFAFFSEMTVKHNHIEGYVKPFLKDVEVYNPEQDKDKAGLAKFTKRLSEGYSLSSRAVQQDKWLPKRVSQVPWRIPRKIPGRLLVNLCRMLSSRRFFRALKRALQVENLIRTDHPQYALI